MTTAAWDRELQRGECGQTAVEQAPTRRQWLDVEGFITDRLLVTYRAPARALRSLVPTPFRLDEYAGYGFVSVCVLEVTDMGLLGAPRGLRFDNRELLYRLGVRYGERATFITLRSDTSSRALATLGARFSHYGLRLAHVSLERAGGFELRCRSRDGQADAHVAVRLQPMGHEPASVFVSATAAAEQLISMSCSVSARSGRVLLQAIEHEPWRPCFVPLGAARFGFLSQLERTRGLQLDYDNTLHVRNVRQVWRAARWQP